MGANKGRNPVLADEKEKLRRDKSRDAIALALDGKWEKATKVNQEILQVFPEDVEALNRSGKALLQLGRYHAAREAFKTAARFAPHNTIAKKNLERLTHLQETTSPPKQGKVVTLYFLIEESGKSGITVLQKSAPHHVLAKMAAGDAVNLKIHDNTLTVENNSDEYVGQVEPKLGMRLLRLMKGGNRYDAAVISMNRQDTSVIIWESYRHPELNGVCSFPTRTKEEYKVYWRDASLRYDIASELEEEDFASEWKERAPNTPASSDGDQSPTTLYTNKARQESESDEEEEEE